MANLLFSNNATTTLASPITSGATSLSVVGGTGALFPPANGGQYFIATLMKIVSGVVTASEIIKVSVRSVDNFTTIVRGQEGTTAIAFSAGDTIALLPTAGGLAQLTQFLDIQWQLTNSAIDTGSANVYVVSYSPALTANVDGMPMRWQASHTNTGASTFNPGPGALSLVLASGETLPANTIIAGTWYTCFHNGIHYQLEGIPAAETQSATDNTTKLATTQFAHTLLALSVTGTQAVNGGMNLSPSGYQVRWGKVSHTVGGNQAHSFSTPFDNNCFVVIPVVASSIGVEFFTVVAGSETASGWTQYSNNTTTINYLAFGN